ncbi:MAG: hypothetical protein PHD81_01995 [Candidatus Nanoarchaeia archaeon]|nr:hypothetical protein [Candidatus Nanoarchaeia archaeon]MDD5587861.1 hypothetical protein [Candidatus Nanoarchaeia archaeon]
MTTLEQYLSKKGDFSQQLTFINKYMPKLLERVRKEPDNTIFQGEYLKLCNWYKSGAILSNSHKNAEEAGLFLGHLVEYHRILKATKLEARCLTLKEKDKILKKRKHIKYFIKGDKVVFDKKQFEEELNELYKKILPSIIEEERVMEASLIDSRDTPSK